MVSSVEDTEQQLLNAVLENPDDDLPRLVYADYIDERGDTRRAEFIRAQIVLCDEVNKKKYDSDEYVNATKQILKYDIFDLLNQFSILAKLEQLKKYKIDIVEDVIRLRNTSENIHYHIDRGFPFCITATVKQFKVNYTDYLLFPIRKFRVNVDSQNGFLINFEILIRKSGGDWISSLLRSDKLLGEKSWLSRSHCYVELWDWFEQKVKTTQLQTRDINYVSESVTVNMHDSRR